MTFILEDFGCDVVGCAADGFLLLSVVLESGGKAKISQFDFHIFVEEEVAEFEAK